MGGLCVGGVLIQPGDLSHAPHPPAFKKSKNAKKRQKCEKKHEIIFQKKMQKKAEMQKKRCKKSRGCIYFTLLFSVQTSMAYLLEEICMPSLSIKAIRSLLVKLKTFCKFEKKIT